MGRKNKLPDDPIEALARYQRNIEDLPFGDELAEMLFRESDRGLVIILGSWIEDSLLDKISEKLVPMNQTERKAFIERGPLRDFHARILMARALGILSEADKAVLETIKAMRNACAHCRRDISFQTPELRAVLVSMLSDNDRRIVEASPKSAFVPKAAFITVCSFVLGIVRGETVDEASARIKLANESFQRIVDERLGTLQGKPSDKPAQGSPPRPKDKGR